MTHQASLVLRLRAWLQSLPDNAVPTTYRDAAAAMQLSPPGTIRQVTEALEIMMREDIAAERPMMAALVISRRGDLPGPGFFELAVALGRFPEDPALYRMAYREELDHALSSRNLYVPS